MKGNLIVDFHHLMSLIPSHVKVHYCLTSNKENIYVMGKFRKAFVWRFHSKFLINWWLPTTTNLIVNSSKSTFGYTKIVLFFPSSESHFRPQTFQAVIRRYLKVFDPNSASLMKYKRQYCRYSGGTSLNPNNRAKESCVHRSKWFS